MLWHPVARGPLVLALVLLALLLLAGWATATGPATPPGGPRPPATAPLPGAALRPSVTGPPVGTWPTFQGGSDRSGFTSSDGPSQPSWAWLVNFASYAPAGTVAHVRSMPAIVGHEMIAADDLGLVLALNTSRNGSLLWKNEVGIEPTAPTVAGPVVLLGDADGGVTALNVSNGHYLWSRNFGGSINQSVLVENSTGIVATRTGVVAAFAVATGAVLWSTPLPHALINGAPAFDGRWVYVTTQSGNVTALNATTGAIGWTTGLSTPLVAGPVAADGVVLVVSSAPAGRMYALSPIRGAVLWNWSDAGHAGSGAGYLASPAVSSTTAYLISNGGGFFAVWLANHTTRWNSTPGQSFLDVGYPLTTPPVVTPRSVFLIDGLEQLDDLNPNTGALRWSAPIGTTSYCPAAIVGDALAYGDDQGNLYWVAPTHAAAWPVSGRVVTSHGAPLPNATVTVPAVALTMTGPGGGFELLLSNGTYAITAEAVGYLSQTQNVSVQGPTGHLTFVLAPVPLFPIFGSVVDRGSYRPLGGVTVRLSGVQYLAFASTVTSPNGSFEILGPPGEVYLSADPPDGFAGTSALVSVPSAPVRGVTLGLVPLGLLPSSPPWPGSLTAPLGSALLPLATIGLGTLGLGFWAVSYTRGRRGLSGRVLSPFGRRITMRLLLVPVQAALLLAILFIFGSMFVEALKDPLSPCPISAGACQSVLGQANCGWNNAACVLVSFGGGWGNYIVKVFTVQWGYDAFGQNFQPVTQMLSWWVPPSIELAVFALAISTLLAYPIGLVAGWNPDRPFDQGARFGSLVGLLLPTFLVILLMLGLLYQPFLNAIGDSPYGLTPSQQWFDAHGGQPSWIGLAGNTLPTGFPLVDALLHADWPFAGVVLAKTLLQATLIAIVYTAIFLRYARHVVAERARSLPVVSARSRGVSESTLLWRHTAREVLPVYVLLFGITLPIYIGTQAVTESLFNDVGIGRILLAEITNVQSTGFGISTGVQSTGNLYQVTIFLLFFLVLIGSIVSDAVAQWLDPRLGRGEGG